MHEDAIEAGDVSRGRLGDVIEAEARFRAHGAVRGHPHFGGGAGVRNNKIIHNEVELMVVSVFVGVDFHVVTVADLLLDVLVHLRSEFIGDDLYNRVTLGGMVHNLT